MTPPILATKLYIPLPRPKAVPRPRLIERLDEGLHSKLILISASAGFGKTTLVSEWVYEKMNNPSGAGAEGGRQKEESPHPSSLVSHPFQVAWLSLDESDNDPARFLAYLVAALQTIAPNMGAGIMAALQTSPPPPLETLLTALLNEIAAIPNPFILVLDDYHVIDTESVDQVLIFLLEHLPPHIRLIIASREDPQLPLARLRARGQLTELRAADLRFTPAEATVFLNRMMGLNLSAKEVSALETRTEGWIAGLQMAALSMQGRTDTAGFIQAFTGSHRFVLDYLVEEVLQRQPERVRSFLLQTALLDRLCASLCDAVTGREDSRGILETLERGNLFILPLDDRRQWYRYHHLFADVLQAHLQEQEPARIPGLHRRASAWYAQNGLPAEAIRHALAAQDFERAASLIELAWSAMDISYQSAMWLGWAKTLPDELVHARPVLSVGYAWALLDSGELDTVEARLQDAERWLDTPAGLGKRPGTPPNAMIVVDEEQFRSLPASIATARAYRALALGDVPAAVKHARQALILTPEEDQIRRTQATALLGVAQYTNGDLEVAEQSLTTFLANLRQTGDILTTIGITFLLADIRLARGRLHEAVNTYQQTLQFATSRGEPMPVGMTDLYRGLSELYCELGDLAVATQHLLTGQKLGEQAVLTGWPHRLCIAEARLREVQGDLSGALDLLDKAERLYVRNPLPDTRPVTALKTRVWLRQGRLTEAMAWVRERGLSIDNTLNYLHEFEHITLARVLIARYQRDRIDSSINDALSLLARLLQAAEAGGRVGSVIEILVLQALANQAQGNIPLALASLARALMLAEPEGYVRIFVDEGLPIAALLGKMRNEDREARIKTYIHNLLTIFGWEEDIRPSAISSQPLVEPLSEREVDVLRLLKTELSGPEIARQLMVSLSTVRTHTQNIFSKLGVNNRRAAIRRAEELDLL